MAVGRRGILLLAALLKRQGEIVTKAELMAINPSCSFADRIAPMPFMNPEDLARIEKGLDRAGLLTSPDASA